MRYELMQYITRFAEPQWEHIASADTLREVKAFAQTFCTPYWVNDTNKGVTAPLQVGWTTCRLAAKWKLGRKG